MTGEEKTENGKVGNGGKPRTSISAHGTQFGALAELRAIADRGKIFLAEITFNETHDDWLMRADYLPEGEIEND